MSRPYEIIAVRDGFEDFIKEIMIRLGVKEEDFSLLFSAENKEKNIKEFAKCFVTPNADPHINYSIYNVAGGTYLNGGIVMFFLSAIQKSQEEKKRTTPSFKPSPKLVDYFSKLKAKYVSNKEFEKISKYYGFDEFIIYGDHDPINDIKQSILSNSLQAFFGCFELLVDRYVRMHCSHIYISRFVTYIFNTLQINYHPSNVYDIITLLKESNDVLYPLLRNQYNQNIQKGTRYEVDVNKDDPNEFVLYKVDYQYTKPIQKTIVTDVLSISKSDENKKIISQRAYDWIKEKIQPPPKRSSSVILPPTPEELNIELLCK